MLLGLIFDLICDVALIQTGVAAAGVYAIYDYATQGNVILCKNYEHEYLIWDWGDDPDKFNFQDFIGLTVAEVKEIIPDIQEKQVKFPRILDYYELNLIFNMDGICTSVEYLRPDDPKWPYEHNGIFPLENTFTESKVLKYKSDIKYPVYIYRKKSFTPRNSIVCHAEIRLPESSTSE